MSVFIFSYGTGACAPTASQGTEEDAGEDAAAAEADLPEEEDAETQEQIQSDEENAGVNDDTTEDAGEQNEGH